MSIGGSAPQVPAQRAESATGSGVAVGFTPGPNVLAQPAGQPYAQSGATLISFHNQRIQNPMTWWVLPPYSGWVSLGFTFAVATAGTSPVSALGRHLCSMGLDDIGPLEQTFQKTSGVGAFFSDGVRPEGPTFYERSFSPDTSVSWPTFVEPSPAHVEAPRLFLPGRRVLLWIWDQMVLGGSGSQLETEKLVDGGMYQVGAP